jgi:TetR/AcrR family transcriptional regulator, ethionamide resistance regulator
VAKSPAPAPARRRRLPEEAEREILDAADPLLRELPLTEVTVSRIMAATTLSRNSFYVYFRDRYDLIVRLVERLRGDADATLDAYTSGAADDPEAKRAALAAAARLYADHGELLRALYDSAAHDDAAARAWAEFAEQTETALTALVRDEMRAGRITGLDPEPTVRALVAMNRACFLQQLVGRPGADVDALVDVLHEIWMRVLYGAGS